MKQVRVLIVMDGFFVGGTETQVLSTVPELIKAGAHVVVVGGDGPLKQAFEALGCTIHHVHFPLGDSVQTLTWREIEAKLHDIVMAERVNLIHAHQIPSARFISKVAKRLNIPMFFTVHGTYYETLSLKAVLGDSVNIISVSPPIHDWLLDSRIQSTIIPNGIPMEQYKPIDRDVVRREYGLATTTPVILYAGRLAWEKADICICVMEACDHIRQEYLPDLQVFIAGDGHGYAAIAKHAEALNAGTGSFVTCLGEQLDMRRIFALADCVVGTGRVALEAMACERAVIAAGCKGMVGLVTPENYDLALNYHFGDHKAERPITEAALAVPITALLLSPESRAILGVEGRRFVESRFNIHDISKQLVSMYQTTLAQSS